MGEMHRGSARGIGISRKLSTVGFEAVDIESTRVYSLADAKALLSAADFDLDTVASQVNNKFMSAFVRARKPS